MSSKGLTPKQQRFVQEYLVDLNATAAYRRAGYSARNDNVAAANAATLLKNHKVAAAIQAAKDARSKRTGVTQDDVIRGLKREARFRGEGSSHSARVAAWGWLGRHMAMFTDKSEVNVKVQPFKVYLDVEVDKV